MLTLRYIWPIETRCSLQTYITSCKIGCIMKATHLLYLKVLKYIAFNALGAVISYVGIYHWVNFGIGSWWRLQMETFCALLAICAGNSPAHKGQWRRALMFSLMCVWINGGVNNREAGDLRHYRAHYDVSVMATVSPIQHVRDFADYLSIICGITFLFVITIWFVVDTYVVSASCWENLSLL